MCSRERDTSLKETDKLETERENLYNPPEKELHSNQASIIKQFENLESTVQM